MASAAEKAPYSDYILSLSMDDLTSEIDRNIQYFLNTYGSAFGYRCSKCNRLSVWHPDGDIENCKQPDSTDDEFLESLRDQLRGLHLITADLSEVERVKEKYNNLKGEVVKLQQKVIQSQSIEKDFETYRNRSRDALTLARQSCVDMQQFQPEISRVKAHEIDCDELLAKFNECTDSMRKLWKCLNASATESADKEVSDLLGFPEGILKFSKPATPFPTTTKTITEASTQDQNSVIETPIQGVKRPTTVRPNLFASRPLIPSAMLRVPPPSFQSATADAGGTTTVAPSAFTPLAIHPVAATTVEAGEDPSTPEEKTYPGLLDKPRTKLKFQRGGGVCGGAADLKAVNQFCKNWATQKVKTHFSKNCSTVEFLEIKRQMFFYLRSYHSNNDLYTLVAMFTHAWGQDYVKVIERLNVEKPQANSFKSFEEYFGEFEKIVQPFMQKHCLSMLQSCRQEDGESLEDYKDRYMELLDMTGQKQERYSWMFTDGIRRRNQKDAIISGCGETDTLTIDQAYDIARRVEMFEQNCFKSQTQPRGQQKDTKKAHVNNTNQETSVAGAVGGVERGGARGRGSARGGRGGQQQQQQQQQQPQQQQSQQQSQKVGRGASVGARGRGRGGARGGARGGVQAKVAFTEVEQAPRKVWFHGEDEGYIQSLHTAKVPPRDATSEEWRNFYEADGDLHSWVSYCRDAMPSDLLGARCEGCLADGHNWNLAFSNCQRNKCCFCATKFFSPRSHPASLCPGRPVDATEARNLMDSFVY